MPKVDKFKKKVNKKDNTRSSINQPQDDYTLDTTRFVKKVEKEREKGNVDYILVALIIALLGFGIVMVLSASAPISTTETGNSYSYAIKQDTGKYPVSHLPSLHADQLQHTSCNASGFI